MEVTAAGFKIINVTGLTVNVQDHLEQNFRLAVGAVSESVTVEGGAAQVNTESAAVSTVVDRQFAENLPMNGRSFQTLIYMTPGVVVVPSNSYDTGQFTVNGQRASSNYWMVDGVSANVGASAVNPAGGDGSGGAHGAFSVLGGTSSLVSVDALQEFRIETSTYAPEFGRTPGAQISILTRSGTNQFHGDLFDYFRNEALDANNWFNGYTNSPPLPKARERQNDFGGTFGGPIFKNRTFFFFSYEGQRLFLPVTTLTTVPDASFTPGGTTNSRQNALPALQPYLNAFPLPNLNSPEILCNPANVGCPSSGVSGSAALNASYSNPATLDAYSIRVDHRINDRLTVFGRYSNSPSSLSTRGPGGTGGNPLSVVEPATVSLQTITVGATSVLSSHVTNDLRFNYSRTHSWSYFYLDNFDGAIPLSTYPFPSPLTLQDSDFDFGIPSLTQGNMNAGASTSNFQRQINLVDSVTWQKGAHTLKLGVDFRRLSPVIGPAVYAQGVLFASVPSAETGQPYSVNTDSFQNSSMLLHNVGSFAQDTWRVFPRLTITYGLRWDIDFSPVAGNGGPPLPAVTGFNLNNLQTLQLAPAGTSVFHTSYGNLAPRLGVAYQLRQNPKWQTVLRGGFGVFNDLITSQVGNVFNYGAYPFGVFNYLPASTTFPLSTSEAVPPPITPPGNGSGEINAYDPNIKAPYTLQWNVAIEQSLGRQQTISASYVGAVGRRLLQTELFFGGASNFSEAELVGNAATSGYNALQIQFHRQLSSGLQALASYTWAHSIDDGSAGSIGLNSNLYSTAATSQQNRGPSDFDIRNTFSLGMTFDIPSPKINSFTRGILGGWAVENDLLARSAPPVDVEDATFYAFSNETLADVRPNLVPGQPVYLYGQLCIQGFGNLCPGGKGFNPNAYTNPPSDPTTGFPLSQGDVPRNFLRGFGATQWDCAIHRTFPVHEQIKLQFRAEMFNVINHPNFGPPSSEFGLGGFGLSQSTLAGFLNSANLGGGAFSPLYQIGGPRSIQLALKLEF